MAEVKKPRAKSTVKSAPKADLVEMAAISAAETVEAVTEAKPASLPAMAATPVEAGAIFSSAKKQGDALRQAMSEAVAASAKGALEVNDKIIDAMNSDTSAAAAAEVLAVWLGENVAPAVIGVLNEDGAKLDFVASTGYQVDSELVAWMHREDEWQAWLTGRSRARAGAREADGQPRGSGVEA